MARLGDWHKLGWLALGAAWVWLSGLLLQGSFVLGSAILLGLGLLLAWPRKPVDEPAISSAHSWIRYRALVDASPDPLWLVDAAGQVVYVNARCVELMEAVGPEELVGEPLQRFVLAMTGKEHLEFPAQDWLNPLLADGPTTIWVRPLGGEPISVEVQAASFADPHTGETLVMLANRQVHRPSIRKVAALEVAEALR